MLGNNLFNVISGYTAIECSVGIYNYNRTKSTKSKTTGLNNLDFFFEAVFYNIFLDFAIGKLIFFTQINKFCSCLFHSIGCISHYNYLVSDSFDYVFSVF